MKLKGPKARRLLMHAGMVIDPVEAWTPAYLMKLKVAIV